MPQDNDAVIVELGGEVTPQNGKVTTMQELTVTTENGLTIPINGTTITSTGTTVVQHRTTSSIANGLQDVVMTEVASHEANHGSAKNGQFLPVEGGYILVEENGVPGMFGQQTNT